MAKDPGVRKGWFEIPGEQVGDRTITEQLRGLEDVDVAGKSVLDLGCAEGMILKHMMEQGASRGAAYEGNPDLFNAACEYLIPLGCEVVFADLNEPQDFGKFDVVLLLAILHKLKNPAVSLRQFAAASRETVVIRLPRESDGIVRWKHGRYMECDTRAVLTELDFLLIRDAEGPRQERVHIWRRANPV